MSFRRSSLPSKVLSSQIRLDFAASSRLIGFSNSSKMPCRNTDHLGAFAVFKRLRPAPAIRADEDALLNAQVILGYLPNLPNMPACTKETIILRQYRHAQRGHRLVIMSEPVDSCLRSDLKRTLLRARLKLETRSRFTRYNSRNMPIPPSPGVTPLSERLLAPLSQRYAAHRSEARMVFVELLFNKPNPLPARA